MEHLILGHAYDEYSVLALKLGMTRAVLRLVVREVSRRQYTVRRCLVEDDGAGCSDRSGGRRSGGVAIGPNGSTCLLGQGEGEK
jgi:hypothetical protein